MGATAELDGVVLLVASHSAPALRNWPWDGALSPGFGGKGWAYVEPSEPSTLVGVGMLGSCAESGRRVFFADVAVVERVCFQQYKLHLIFLSFSKPKPFPSSQGPDPQPEQGRAELPALAQLRRRPLLHLQRWGCSAPRLLHSQGRMLLAGQTL